MKSYLDTGGLLIRDGSIEEALALSLQIPEFSKPYIQDDYAERLKDRFSKILIASFNGILCGFKVAYSRDDDPSLYSWMGGVLPEYRRKGIARNLSKTMEYLAIQNHFHKLKVKTYNRHRNMLLLLLSEGFYITSCIPSDKSEDTAIYLEKMLYDNNRDYRDNRSR